MTLGALLLLVCASGDVPVATGEFSDAHQVVTRAGLDVASLSVTRADASTWWVSAPIAAGVDWFARPRLSVGVSVEAFVSGQASAASPASLFLSLSITQRVGRVFSLFDAVRLWPMLELTAGLTWTGDATAFWLRAGVLAPIVVSLARGVLLGAGPSLRVRGDPAARVSPVGLELGAQAFVAVGL